MISLLTGFPDNVLAVACEGQVTRQDYASVLVPAVEAALRQHDRLRIYYEQFAGIDAGGCGRISRSASGICRAMSAWPASPMSNGSALPSTPSAF